MNWKVGGVYVRTKPIIGTNGKLNYDYCTTPIKVLGYTGKTITYCYTRDSQKGRILKEGPRILPLAYCDNFWVFYNDVLIGDDWCALDHFAGQKIYRKEPLETENSCDDTNFGFSFDVLDLKTKTVDESFVGPNRAVTLVSATKTHVAILDKKENIVLLDERYAKCEDWAVVQS